MEALYQLTHESEETRLGTLAVLHSLCEQDPVLAGATAHIVQTAMSQWETDGSQTQTLADAARLLLAVLEQMMANEPLA